ncbi:MAG TPA: ATP-binding protein [Solirubrobacteraceae bacterium]|nr:ATP-binding protein [Solirubrobacteraceae bacterium]
MGTKITFGRTCGSDGFGADLPLRRDLSEPIVVDLSALRDIHAMFAIRLRIFIDWHVAAGHALQVLPPADAVTAQRLADIGVADGLPADLVELPSPRDGRTDDVLPLTRFVDHTTVEDIARDAVALLRRQTDPLGSWGDAIYMAVGELCDNALQHGRNDLGAYIAADRITEPQPAMRLAIADLGIGIPEHIRSRHPEWYDDDFAISQAITSGVTGTGDPGRGYGFAEVFDQALRTDLVRASSGADIDIRAGEGRIGMRIFGHTEVPERRNVKKPRRGTWITYTVTTAA